MSAIKLHVIKPSVNNMTARVFVRAAKLPFTEDDVYGKTRSEGFLAKNPAHLTPMMEGDDLPKGVLWESCAIMQYLCNKHHLDQFYPTAPAERAMIDSAMFYIIGTLYPYLARATYPAPWAFPNIPAKSAPAMRTRDAKAAAQKAAHEALAEPLHVLHSFYMRGKPFIGGDHPSIADIRLAATLEFLAVIDYKLPRLGVEIHRRDGKGARRRLQRARCRRARLHRLCEIAKEITLASPARRRRAGEHYKAFMFATSAR